jgi:LDH2 family malate/lactate/ureidoglycolate dehydrogenase
MTHTRYSPRARAGILLAASAILVGVAMAAGVASAQPINGRAPWCGTFSQYGGTLDCAYYSLEQCMAGASGVSNQCSRNPWYVARPGRGPHPRPRDWRW